MFRISDEKFLKAKPREDSVYAIRVENGKLYFLAHMEGDGSTIKVKKAKNTKSCELDMSTLLGTGDLQKAVEETDGYNDVYCIYFEDENGIPDPKNEFDDEYVAFLNEVESYKRDGRSDKNDHDIFLMTEADICSFIDVFRDGDYVIVLE